jgi:hypothetical protein
MRGLYILLVVAAAGAAGTAKPDSIGRVIVAAHPAIVEIKPLSDDRRLISLPALEFALTIEPQCATDMQAESISISIADTQKTYGAVAIDGRSIVEISLTIPRRQIGPLAAEAFCRAGKSDDIVTRTLLVQDAFTAQLSLRCISEEKRSIIYVSQPLDVKLHCQNADDDSNPPTDQESSPTSILR